jgi:hypothetical protein
MHAWRAPECAANEHLKRREFTVVLSGSEVAIHV